MPRFLLMVEQQTDQSPRRTKCALIAALLAGLAIVAVGEVPRLRAIGDGGSLAAWFVDMNLDTTPFALLLLLLPAFWFVRRPLFRRQSRFWERVKSWSAAPAERQMAGWWEWLAALLVLTSSIGGSLWVAERPGYLRPFDEKSGFWTTRSPGGFDGGRERITFGQLPPAYHDEYSYLFMAKTFLAGRLAFPSHPAAPELFDQMHVLNDDGRFASRFFPATGAWMAPFVALGRPYWGHWLAGGLTAFFLFWAGRELGGNGVGLSAGLLTAASPGMALFSNLLLAHHPCLVGLSLFLFAFLRMMRTPRWTWALAGGVGLGFAMLCRPMTAAGFGLPFGLWFAWWIVRGGGEEQGGGATRFAKIPARLRIASILVLPILLGLGVQMRLNRAITGSVWVTPYQRFTDIYTPRHVYGFNNVIRGERRLGPKVIENYDRWTENLSPRLWERDASGKLKLSLASQNVVNRIESSLRWSMGLVPLSMAGVFFLVAGAAAERRWWLVAAAIASLHLAHVPYWYDGIMHWHYVFESGPLWLLLFAGVTQRACRGWIAAGRPLMPVWWALLVAAALLTNYSAAAPFWETSKMEAAVGDVGFARGKYEAFRRRIAAEVNERPALVLVEADPADRHIDYVTNDPGLSASVLFGRYLGERTNVDEVRRLFPDRAIYLYRAATGKLERLGDEA